MIMKKFRFKFTGSVGKGMKKIIFLLTLLFCSSWGVTGVHAEIYLVRDVTGQLILTDRPSSDHSKENTFTVLIESEWPETKELPTPGEIQTIIQDASDRHGVPRSLIYSVLHVESDGDSQAHSDEGAKGLMQLMPATARHMGVENIWDPEENINGGTKYLKKLIERYEGDLTRVLAAYNAGPRNVSKYDGVPPYPETRKFVNRVRNRFEKLRPDRKTIYTYRDENGMLHVTNIR